MSEPTFSVITSGDLEWLTHKAMPHLSPDEAIYLDKMQADAVEVTPLEVYEDDLFEDGEVKRITIYVLGAPS